ncbi:MAG: hypothetical protein VW124_15630, partial [Paracoccaceae bacterium]
MVSFFCGVQGNCPSEWADDKLKIAKLTPYEFIVACGPYSKSGNPKGDYRVPSLSVIDWFTEFREARRLKTKLSLNAYLVLPAVLTLGLFIDIVMLLVTRGVSGGKWSWTFFLVPTLFLIILTKKIDVIFATGGPNSAHLASSIVAKLLGKRLICELQDPIVSHSFKTNTIKAWLATFLEGFIIFSACKTVFVTEKASWRARARHPDHFKKVQCIYPYSWNFNSEVGTNLIKTSFTKVRLLHLGTLYGDRNLNTLLDVIDKLNSKSEIQIEIDNIGDVYLENKNHYLNMKFCNLIRPMGRQDALQASNSYDILVLAQHASDISLDTIPYKLNDYINLGKPILALRRNLE